MKSGIALFLAFASLFAMTLSLTPLTFAAVGGPATQNMLIKIYFDPTVESMALDKGEIDLNDWPLAKEYIDKWSPPTSEVALASVSELGKMEIDINNQRWPTGWGGVGPGEPAAPRNEFFDDPSNPGVPKNQRHMAAWRFRRAVAHLTNKPKIITDFLKGYGYAMETPVPVPALEKYTDYGETGTYGLQNAAAKAERADNTYADKGFIYEFDPEAAKRELALGGFLDWDADGVIEWRDIGPDMIANTTDDATVKEELPTMNFYIRIDDPNRRQAGEDLANEMSKVGIKKDTEGGPLHIEVRERSTCFNEVMVRYNYNLYTGGWDLGADLDLIYDLYASQFGQYAWANNYAGFKNYAFDAVAYDIKYPPTLDDAVLKPAAQRAQWVMAKFIPVVELWASKMVKGYRKGWEGVANMIGEGIDQGYTFHEMWWNAGAGGTRTGPADTIVWGFKSDISNIHVIASEWMWDWNVLERIYDSAWGRNPYELTEDVGALATFFEIGSWDAGTKTYVKFTLPTDLKFHDGSTLTPEDMRFSIIFPRDLGTGAAWNYPVVMDVARVDTQAQDGTLGPNDVKVYFGVTSGWALHWAGGMPIINKKLWMAACGPGTATGYSGPTSDGSSGTFTNAMAVRDYHPWEHDVYNAGTGGAGSDGVIDLEQDGTSDWSFKSYVPGQSVTLQAWANADDDITVKSKGMYLKDGTYVNPGVYYTMATSDLLENAFHRFGDVTYNMRVDISDLSAIAKWLTKFVPPAPTNADITGDKFVDVDDLWASGKNFGQKFG